MVQGAGSTTSCHTYRFQMYGADRPQVYTAQLRLCRIISRRQPKWVVLQLVRWVGAKNLSLKV